MKIKIKIKIKIINYRINGLKLYMKKSINEELYNSIKREHLIDLYFRNKDEPYEEVINITLDEEADAESENKMENELNSSEQTIINKSNIANIKHNEIFSPSFNSEIHNKINKYNEDTYHQINYDSYLCQGESNFYTNNSNYDIYKFKENSNQIVNQMNSGLNSNFKIAANNCSNINYHSYPLLNHKNASVASLNMKSGKKDVKFLFVYYLFCCLK